MSVEFPMCCGVRIICNFGGTALTSGDTELKIRDIIEHDLKYYMNLQKQRGYALVTIILNDDQKEAIEVVEELGFSGTGWIDKDKHNETKLQMYWIKCSDYNEFE